MKRAPISESALQKQCVEWLTVQQTMGHLRFASVPNEGKRSFNYARKLKTQGLAKGFPDLIVMIAPRTFPGVRAPKSAAKVVFLELKSKAGRLTEEQSDWQMWLRDNAFSHHIIRSFDDLQAAIGPLISVREAA